MATRRNALGEAIARGGQAFAEAITRRAQIQREQEQQAFDNRITEELLQIRRDAEDRAALTANMNIGFNVLDRLGEGVMSAPTFVNAFAGAGGNAEELVGKMQMLGIDPEDPDYMMNPETFESLMDDRKMYLINPETNPDENSRIRWMNLFSGNGFFTEEELEAFSVGELTEAQAREKVNNFILNMDDLAFAEFQGMAPGGSFTNDWGTARSLEGAKFLASLDELWMRYSASEGAQKGEVLNQITELYLDEISKANERNGEEWGGTDILALRKAIQAGLEGGEENWQYLAQESVNPARTEAYRRYITGMFTGSIAERGLSSQEQFRTMLNVGEAVGWDENRFNEVMRVASNPNPLFARFGEREGLLAFGSEIRVPDPGSRAEEEIAGSTPWTELPANLQNRAVEDALLGVQMGVVTLEDINEDPTLGPEVVNAMAARGNLERIMAEGERRRARGDVPEIGARGETAEPEPPSFESIYSTRLDQFQPNDFMLGTPELFLSQVEQMSPEIRLFIQENFLGPHGEFRDPGFSSRRQLQEEFFSVVGNSSSEARQAFQSIYRLASEGRLATEGVRERNLARRKAGLIERLTDASRKIMQLLGGSE